jgi:hypothetical protein
LTRRLSGGFPAYHSDVKGSGISFTELEVEKRQLQEPRASAETSHNTVRLHPNAAALYAASPV